MVDAAAEDFLRGDVRARVRVAIGAFSRVRELDVDDDATRASGAGHRVWMCGGGCECFTLSHCLHMWIHSTLAIDVKRDGDAQDGVRRVLVRVVRRFPRAVGARKRAHGVKRGAGK